MSASRSPKPVRISSRPSGFSTRAISRAAAALSGTWCSDRNISTASADWSGNGIAAASPRR